jgi:hypothetical protein
MVDTEERPEEMVSQPKRRLTKRAAVMGGAGLAVLLIIAIVIVSSHHSNKPIATQNKSGTSPSSTSASTTSTPRQAQGTATTLGAGTFTVGTDVAQGLYDVSAPSGQSGNFVVRSSASSAVYNEFIGNPEDGSVSKIRVRLTNGEQIQISDMSGVRFTPVTAPLVTAHSTIKLYAGTFVVGEDIGAGKYVVTPASGQSGNFFIDGNNGSNKNKVDEILGDSSEGNVPSVTTTVDVGDVITLSGIDSVTFTAQ